MSTTTQSPDTAEGAVLRQMMRPLERYLRDDNVREITIPRPGVILVRTFEGWRLEARDEELSIGYVQALIAAMASFNKVEFDSLMSLILPDGERAQIARAPAVLEGTISLNIRKHSAVVKTLEELAAGGAFVDWVDTSGSSNGTSSDEDSLTPHDVELKRLLHERQMYEFLIQAVESRRNIIIAGKTGSGKTTFARSLIEKVPVAERIITVEDVHELMLPNHTNRVHLVYGAGRGRKSATDCIAAAMRMSPDRIFLSELRGPETWDYLSALNTGHPGSVTTTHANSARDSHSRVALLVKQSPAGQSMDVETIMRYLQSTLDIALYFANYKLAEVYFNPSRSLLR